MTDLEREVEYWIRTAAIAAVVNVIGIVAIHEEPIR